MLNKNFKICFIIILSLLSCKTTTSKLYIECNGELKYGYEVMSVDGKILISFIYDENYASFPIRIIIPNYNLNNPMMIYIEFDENLNITSYKISDGILFEDLVLVLPDKDIYVTHRMRIKNDQVIYSIKNDRSIEIIEISKIDSIDQF